jgi:hypothetical protein
MHDDEDEPGIFASGDFSATDREAKKAPSGATASIEALAAWLTGAATGAIEKARAIYSWIAANIEYDVDQYFRKSGIGDGSAAKALARGKAVCAGYAALFTALGEAAGLEVKTISGHAKGYGYRSGDPDLESNHAWNAVKIGDDWRLVDSTWGAGYIDTRKRFERRFTDFYFLTPARYFIFNHFPDDPAWQLMPKAVDAATYRNIINVHAGFFEYGISLLNYPRARIETDGDIDISFKAKTNFEISTELSSDGFSQKAPLSFGQREGDAYAVHCVFPFHGDYELTVFGRDRALKEPFRSLFSYSIRAMRGAPRKAARPDPYGAFGELNARLIEPFDGFLKRGFMRNFKILVPGASDVAVVNGSEWTHLKRSPGDLFEGTVFVMAGEAIIYAQLPGEKDYRGLVKFETF